MANLPVKITPCPIIESNIEIRFVANFPPDAVIGIIYNLLLSNGYQCTLSQRPIMQLPAEIRAKDPQLQYQATHTIAIQNPKFFVHVGPSVCVIQIPIYIGWAKFREIINSIVVLLQRNNLFKRVDSIGLKYVNFFKLDIFDKIVLKIEGLSNLRSTIFRTEILNEKYVNILQISNGVHVNNPYLQLNADGSLIDITTVVLSQHGLDSSNIMTHIDEARLGEKSLFFSLLKEDYLDTLSPEYDQDIV